MNPRRFGTRHVTGALLVTTLLASGNSAGGQDAGAKQSTGFQVGVHLVAIQPNVAKPMGIGAHVITHPNGRFGFQTGFDWKFQGADEGGLRTLYFLLLRHAINEPARARTTVFANYGVFGYSSRSRTQTGWSTSVSAPILPAAGVTLQRRLADRLRMHGGADLIFGVFGDLRPVTPRAHGGISVTIGE